MPQIQSTTVRTMNDAANISAQDLVIAILHRAGTDLPKPCNIASAHSRLFHDANSLTEWINDSSQKNKFLQQRSHSCPFLPQQSEQSQARDTQKHYPCSVVDMIEHKQDIWHLKNPWSDCFPRCRVTLAAVSSSTYSTPAVLLPSPRVHVAAPDMMLEAAESIILDGVQDLSHH